MSTKWIRSGGGNSIVSLTRSKFKIQILLTNGHTFLLLSNLRDKRQNKTVLPTPGNAVLSDCFYVLRSRQTADGYYRNISCLMIISILINCLLETILMLSEEIRCWSCVPFKKVIKYIKTQNDGKGLEKQGGHKGKENNNIRLAADTLRASPSYFLNDDRWQMFHRYFSGCRTLKW